MDYRVLFIAPRFHTNQVFPIKGLIQNGVKVKFISHYKHKVENYEDIEPCVLGYSIFTKLILKVLFWLNDSQISFVSRTFGLPPLIKSFVIIKRFKPDLVIIRDRTLYSAVMLNISRILNIKCVMYTQTPKYSYKRTVNSVKDKIKYRIKNFIFGIKEITPLLGEKKDGEEYPDDNKVYYVPFSIQFNSVKNNLANNKEFIKIIMVSEFIERKKILETLEVVNRILAKNYPIQFTIIGNAKKNNAQIYLKKVIEYIDANQLQNNVIIKTDIPHRQVLEEYTKNDIFVFSAINESAGYSILEAMSCGLAVICSSGIGMKDYIERNKSGYIFEQNNFDELYHYLIKLLDNPQLIEDFGDENMKLIKINYSLEKYYINVKNIIESSR